MNLGLQKVFVEITAAHNSIFTGLYQIKIALLREKYVVSANKSDCIITLGNNVTLNTMITDILM